MDTNNEIFNRLNEYKVDFLYSSQNFFNATKRIKKKNDRLFIRRKRLAVLSIILAILSLSGVAFYYSQKYTEITIGLIGLFSIIAVLVDIFLLIDPRTENECEYQKRGEEYLDLYKSSKNTEIFYKAGGISKEELIKEIKKLAEMDNKLRAQPLMILEEDYNEAKKNIENGNYEYTKKEKKI